MIELNKNNIFLLNLGFGYENINKIVVANNPSEALLTINEYYESPEVRSIISLEKLDQLIQKLNSPNINVIFEYTFDNNEIFVLEHERTDSSFEELRKEFENKTCLIANRQTLLLSVAFIFEEFKKQNEMIIWADSINIDEVNFTFN